MKSTLATVLSTATLASAQWWGGAPDCAHDCLSSAWSAATTWPSPGDYCTASTGNSVASCLSASCTANPTAWSSYSSLSSSLCSHYTSCSSAGSTAVYTVSAPDYTSWSKYAAGGGGGGGGGGRWYGGGAGASGDHSWTGGVYTVTGCEWSGSPWAGGPNGAGAGPGPWGQWGNAWSWTTTTVDSATGTATDGAQITAPATMAVAVSGQVSSTTTLGVFGAEVSGKSAAGAGPAVGVKVAGAALVGVIGFVALL